MKKFSALLAALLFLAGMAACGDTSVPAGEGLPEESVTLQEKFQKNLEQTFAFSLFSTAYEREYLKGYGITAYFENIKAEDASTCTFDLALTNSEGKCLTLPLSARCSYDYTDGAIKNLRAEWGGINVPREGILAIFGGNTLALLDTATMELLPFQPDFSSISQRTCYPAGIVWQQGLGYVVPCTDLRSSRILLFDEAGSLQRDVPLVADRNGRSPFVHPQGDMADHYATPEIVVLDAQYVKLTNAYYNLDSGSYFDLYDEVKITDGSSSIKLYHCLLPTEENDTPLYAALLCQEDKSIDFLLFRNEEIDALAEDLTGTVDVGARRVSLFSDTYGMTLSLDFTAPNCTVRHEPQSKHLVQKLAESADNAYSLWSANEQSGGDAYFYNIVLRDNASGLLTYLCPSGGMWGGFGDVGFLKNNDLYIMDGSSLKIYEPQTAKCTFSLGDRFPLGEVPEESLQRILFAFRRDPVDYSFIVVYAEAPLERDKGWGEKEISENDLHYYSYPFHYLVGRCDSTGALLQSWDTGKCVIGGFFGLSSIELRLSGDQLTLIGSAGKGYPAFSGVFDLATSIYRDNGFS